MEAYRKEIYDFIKKQSASYYEFLNLIHHVITDDPSDESEANYSKDVHQRFLDDQKEYINAAPDDTIMNLIYLKNQISNNKMYTKNSLNEHQIIGFMLKNNKGDYYFIHKK